MTTTGQGQVHDPSAGEYVRQGAATRSGHSRAAVMGVFHSGFGFGPQAIKDESRNVARRRSSEAEIKRKAASQVKLKVGAASPQQGLHPRTVPVGAGQRPPKSQFQPVFQRPQDDQVASPESRLAKLELESVARERRDYGAQPAVPAEAQADSQGDLEEAGLAGALGRKPGRFAVVLAVGVDASFSFASLAAADLLAQLGGHGPLLQGLLTESGLWSSVESLYATLGTVIPASLVPPLPEALHWALVVPIWALAVFMVQWALMSVFRGTLGRTLVGIGVNPVASASRGTVLVPLFEVLTFGGLFSLPVTLLRPDKHVFLPGIRFQS